MTIHTSFHMAGTFRALMGAAICATLIGACEGNLGTAGDGGTGGTGGQTQGSGQASDSGGGADLPCSKDDPCPSGQFCFNGVCAYGCTSNEDCADDQYCDTAYTRTCQNREVPGCATDEDCGPGRICVSGLCSTPPDDTTCDPQGVLVGDDGCAEDALCVEDPEVEGKVGCYTFPPCGADGTCPVGTGGAVCNVDLVPGKGRICLVGMCTGVEHCPADWACAVPDNQVLGLCTAGTPGWPCARNEDCDSGLCQILQPGTLGFCA